NVGRLQELIQPLRRSDPVHPLICPAMPVLELMRLRSRCGGGAIVKLSSSWRARMKCQCSRPYGAFYGSWSRMPSVDHEIRLTDMRAAIAALPRTGYRP